MFLGELGLITGRDAIVIVFEQAFSLKSGAKILIFLNLSSFLLTFS